MAGTGHHVRYRVCPVGDCGVSMSIGAKITIFIMLFGIVMVIWACCAMAGEYDERDGDRR